MRYFFVDLFRCPLDGVHTMMDITKKWTGRRQDWSMIYAQMAIYFAERMHE